MDTFDSDYGDSDQISLSQYPASVINMPTAYRAPSYLKDEFSGGPPLAMDRSSRGPSIISLSF